MSSKHVIDVKLLSGPYGPYFMGNLQFPATVDARDLIIKVIPDDEGDKDTRLMQLLKELDNEYEGKLRWTVEIEPRRKKKYKNNRSDF